MTIIVVSDYWAVTSAFVGKRYVHMGHMSSGVYRYKVLTLRGRWEKALHGLCPGSWLESHLARRVSATPGPTQAWICSPLCVLFTSWDSLLGGSNQPVIACSPSCLPR